MSLSLALIALVTASAPPEDDIVVIGRRLAGISVMVGRDAKGRYTCDLSASTGNARLDERLCKTAATCVRKGAASKEAVSACIDERKPALLDQVRAELAGRTSSAAGLSSILRVSASPREQKEVGFTRRRGDAEGVRSL